MSRREDELMQFVRESLARGLTRPQIEVALREAGWSPDQTANALGAWSAVDFPLPVPNPLPYVSAREAFLYLVLYTTLFVSAYSLGDLIFSFIERGLPDPVTPDWGLDDGIRWAIARLVVSAPVFLFTAHRVGRMIAADPAKQGSPVRKWLTYVALFIAASIVIGDVVTLISYALGGELTLRFILKIVTVAVIAGAIFVYYLHDLGRDEKPA
ncbi:MAG: DUF5671 domain-containing protein [Dongiaceae bacterium]